MRVPYWERNATSPAGSARRWAAGERERDLQGNEGDPTPWDGRPTEAESPLLSQGSSSFFSPPPSL